MCTPFFLIGINLALKKSSCFNCCNKCTGYWWGNLRKRDHWGDPGVDERIILRWIFRKWDVGVWTGSSWLRIGIGGGQM